MSEAVRRPKSVLYSASFNLTHGVFEVARVRCGRRVLITSFEFDKFLQDILDKLVAGLDQKLFRALLQLGYRSLRCCAPIRGPGTSDFLG